MPRDAEFQLSDGVSVRVRVSDRELVGITGLTHRKIALLTVMFEDLCGADPTTLSDREVVRRVVQLIHHYSGGSGDGEIRVAERSRKVVQDPGPARRPVAPPDDHHAE